MTSFNFLKTRNVVISEVTNLPNAEDGEKEGGTRRKKRKDETKGSESKKIKKEVGAKDKNGSGSKNEKTDLKYIKFAKFPISSGIEPSKLFPEISNVSKI